MNKTLLVDIEQFVLQLKEEMKRMKHLILNDQHVKDAVTAVINAVNPQLEVIFQNAPPDVALIEVQLVVPSTAAFWIAKAEETEKAAAYRPASIDFFGMEDAGFAYSGLWETEKQLAKMYRHLAGINAPIPDFMQGT